ncbi:GbpC/Spa domain-containing protein [uncultured Streptococcus sp.]|uniref:GbpC/Spa domain-containing protein n=1 Tax=uncultured Streptococcus sp. TaxID=83427 RepID=UPI0026775EAC|nr:GbpC/Spa domain-containing protein [uncultured Streptococcus sp.]
MRRKDSQRFSIRKYSFGAASVLLGTTILAMGTTGAHADEVSTSAATDTPLSASVLADTTTDATATVDHSEKQVVSVKEVGNTTETMSVVTSDSLEDAKASALKEGVKVEETAPQTHTSLEGAIADNQAQAKEINSVVSDYQKAKEEHKKELAEYDKAKTEYDAKVAEKAAADKVNAASKAQFDTDQAAYEKELAKYQADKKAYDAALEEYHIQKLTYDFKVAEKVAADAANAKSEADYKVQLAVYETAKKNYEAAMAQYTKDKAKYDAEKKAYDAKVAEKVLTEIENKAAQEQYEKELATYNAAYEKYQNDLAAYKTAKVAYDAKIAEKTAVEKSNAEAKAKYDAEMATYNVAKAQYETDLKEYQIKQAQYDKDKVAYDKLLITKAEEDTAKAKYETDLAKYNAELEQYAKDFATYQTKYAEYQAALAQYKEAKAAYDKYMNDNGFQELKDVETVQDLTFQREAGAIHTITGIDTYLTREAQARLNTSNVHQYDSNKLTASDIVTTSPWANNETEYIQIKEGDKFVVTYDNLNKSSMREASNMHPIKRVIYRYDILSLPSNDGKGIAAVNGDPTVTLTVGASSDQDKPIKVAVDIEFYDGNGKRFDLSQKNAIVALNSLNHWTGASYVDSGDKPRALTVEAKDQNGNTVRGTWNPYADGSSMSIENNAVTVKTGTPDFGSAKVTISAENPMKIVAQQATWNGSEFAVSEETVIDATSVNASGAGEGHSIGTDNYLFDGKDDVIGMYTINPITGDITFTPKKKFENLEHIESVSIGNNKYIAIPNSSVSYDATTKEVKSLKDNQYIEHGSAFNGESSPVLEGWDNPESPYLYYGGAGLKMLDGHLVFTAQGANAVGQPTVYWFAINSNVGLPKKPGEEPKEPTKPEEPKAPTPPTITVGQLPAKPTEPTPPTAPIAPREPSYTVVTVDAEAPKAPTEPKAPTPPTPALVEVPVEPRKITTPVEPKAPTPPTPVVVEVPAEPTKLTPPTEPKAPTPPTMVVVNVPNKPVSPKELVAPKVKWHKNYLLERVSRPEKTTPPTPQKPKTPRTPVVPSVTSTSTLVTKQSTQGVHDKTLPETSDKNQKLTSVAGIGILSVALAGLFTSYKRKH